MMTSCMTSCMTSVSRARTMPAMCKDVLPSKAAIVSPQKVGGERVRDEASPGGGDGTRELREGEGD